MSDSAWTRGYRAFKAGMDMLQDNPYPRHSDDWYSWCDGWVAAADDAIE